MMGKIWIVRILGFRDPVIGHFAGHILDPLPRGHGRLQLTVDERQRSQDFSGIRCRHGFSRVCINHGDH